MTTSSPPASNHPRQRALWIALGFASLAMLLLLALFQSSTSPSRYSGETISQLETSEALVRIGELADLGDEAVPMLVPLLGDSRAEVGDAAHIALHRRIDRWRMRSARKSATDTCDLAHRLSRYAPAFSPLGGDAPRIWPSDYCSFRPARKMGGRADLRSGVNLC